MKYEWEEINILKASPLQCIIFYYDLNLGAFYAFDSAKNDLDITPFTKYQRNYQMRISIELISTICISRFGNWKKKMQKHVLLNKQADKLIDFNAMLIKMIN